MQYALLIYENEAESYPDGEAGQAWQDILAAHFAFGGELAQSGAMRGGAGLKSSQLATTVKVTPEGRTVHDGPFAETREQLGGLYMIEVPDLDAAIAWAKKLPIAKRGSIEIRPLLPTPEGL
ncbi:YciI family protein [Brevundimonas balnearis]|uniref:YciI family protein n=1 Tax=Brevundimonas balnearis TaxID=1572858 RepID=A0ABV6R3G2_9CAUL